LELLRELDSEIDFARGVLQLRILIEVSKVSSGLSVKEISSRIGQRYRAVVDALRKLEAKGLVVRDGAEGSPIFKLSEKGYEFYKKLEYISSHRVQPVFGVLQAKVKPQDFALDAARMSYVQDALVAVGTSRRGEATLKTIAQAMGLSIQRAQSYIEQYSSKDSPLRLFKPVVRLNGEEGRLIRLAKSLLKRFGLKLNSEGKTVYTLTDEGWTAFYRLPVYMKYSNSLGVKILRSLFGNAHPRITARKLLRTVSAMNILSAVAAVALMQTPVASVLLLAAASLATAVLLALYISAYNL